MLRLDCRSEAELVRGSKTPPALRRVVLQLQPTREENGLLKDTTGFTPAWYFNFNLLGKRMGSKRTPPALRRVVLQLQPTREENGVLKDTTGFTPCGTSTSAYLGKTM